MNKLLFLGSALGVLLLCGTASAAIETYTATLNGAQESPAVQTNATGNATFELDTTTKKLTGTVNYTGLSGEPNAGHIHAGACGANGAPLITFEKDGDHYMIKENEPALNDGQIADLQAGKLYVNIHTDDHANGEIRGQIFKQGSTDKCPAGGQDAGTSGGTDAGTSGGTSGATSGGTSGATSGGTSGGTSGTNTATTTAEDDGCSTTGSSPGNGLAIALGVGLAVAAASRGRRKR